MRLGDVHFCPNHWTLDDKTSQPARKMPGSLWEPYWVARFWGGREAGAVTGRSPSLLNLSRDPPVALFVSSEQNLRRFPETWCVATRFCREQFGSQTALSDPTIPIKDLQNYAVLTNKKTASYHRSPGLFEMSWDFAFTGLNFHWDTDGGVLFLWAEPTHCFPIVNERSMDQQHRHHVGTCHGGRLSRVTWIQMTCALRWEAQSWFKTVSTQGLPDALSEG